MSGEATFEVQSWDEKPAKELGDGAKLSRARVSQAYRGDIQGAGTVEYVMCHHSDGSAEFLGFEHVEGALLGQSGSLVLRHAGVFETGIAKSTWQVVPGSGRGGLHGAVGSGSFEAGHDMTGRVTFRVEFD